MPKKIDRRSDGAPRNVFNDPRFSSMHSAPTFKKVQKDNKKIKVDERFKKVLTDDRFRAVPGAIDIYGRKAKKGAKSAAEKELDSFYQIDDSIVSVEEENSEVKAASCSNSTSGKVSKGNDKRGADGTKGEEAETRLEYLNRLARGDVSGSSSESEEERFSDVDSDDSDEEGEGTAVEERGGKQRGPLDIPEEEYEEEEDGEEAHSTDRLALMNCDWASLKAQDLMSVLQSFCPPGKTIDRITVYPSDYGKEKMANEVIHGPPKIWNGIQEESDVDDSDGDDSDGEDEGYDGIAAIDHDDTAIPTETKRSDKWKRNQMVKKGKEDSKENEEKAKVSKSDRKGDFKRLPGTIGLVMQDDLVMRGLNRRDDANEEELESGGEEGEENYFDGDLSKGNRTDEKGRKVQSQVKGKDKRNTLEREKFTGAGKGDVDGEGGFDEIALRAYELSKLKYYFAVAEISSVDAAESLMTQLDGVELGHSSMMFDLRFIPEDTSFHGRDIRDQCTTVGSDYQPPDFIVNALQHTTVQCSWDEGEKDREKKLTTISQWRTLQESELLQYIASSDSDDEEENEDDASEVADSDNDNDDSQNMETKRNKVKQSDKQRKSAANLRKLLLGGGDDDDFENDSEDEKSNNKGSILSKGKATGGNKDKGFEDDFFRNDGDDGEEEQEDEEEEEEEEEEVVKPVKKTSKSLKGNKKEEGDMTFTYIPEEKPLQGKDKNKKVEEDHGDETPFEKMQRQLAEKKKARKAAKKLKSKGGEIIDEDISTGNKSNESSKDDGKSELERLKAEKAELELLLSDDDDDYDMRAIHKAEKDALKGAKGKRKSRNRKPKDGEEVDVVAGGDFELDLTDNRFASLLGGDSKFGIDRTSSEFKETKAMKQILGEQRNRREREEKSADIENRDANMTVEPIELANNDENTESLVAKLKRKYAEQGSKPKKARL